MTPFRTRTVAALFAAALVSVLIGFPVASAATAAAAGPAPSTPTTSAAGITPAAAMAELAKLTAISKMPTSPIYECAAFKSLACGWDEKFSAVLVRYQSLVLASDKSAMVKALSPC